MSGAERFKRKLRELKIPIVEISEEPQFEPEKIQCGIVILFDRFSMLTVMSANRLADALLESGEIPCTLYVIDYEAMSDKYKELEAKVKVLPHFVGETFIVENGTVGKKLDLVMSNGVEEIKSFLIRLKSK